MAEIKVSQLPEATQINDEDLLMIVQGNANKKITKANAKFASGDEVYIGDTEPTGEDDDSVKIWVEPSEDSVESEGTYISNSYGVSTEIGYSEAYLNNNDSYSTSEIKTNKRWIDGKPIYRKVIDLGTLPNATSKYVETGLTQTNIRIIDLYGVAYISDGSYQCTLNDLYARLNLIPINKIAITTTADFSLYSGYAIIEYIKTTD